MSKVSDPNWPKSLIGQKLDDLKVVEFFGVFGIDSDDNREVCIGYVQNEDVAEALAAGEKISKYTTRRVFLLTDGRTAMTLGHVVGLLDPEEALQEAKRIVLASIPLAYRRLLKLD